MAQDVDYGVSSVPGEGTVGATKVPGLLGLALTVATVVMFLFVMGLGMGGGSS
ncbi:hypothetical protein [Streptomyces sp. 4F14]|uniref:hypothetical protein n=1 Tax=Streptomyces sp. 4F14 TaxID=3394380 RepID=UPI003A8458F7